MSLQLIFWVLMLLCLILGGIPVFKSRDYGSAGTGLVVWLLFLILGWAQFGAPINGHG